MAKRQTIQPPNQKKIVLENPKKFQNDQPEVIDHEYQLPFFILWSFYI